MFESKEEKQRKQTRERVKRFRDKKKAAVNTVTEPLQPVTSAVTASAKMLCKCLYFTTLNGVLVCAQCGKPAPAKAKVEDKIRRGVEFK